MSLDTAVETGTLEEAFKTLRAELRTERERTAAERDAFEAFARAVKGIDARESLRMKSGSNGGPGSGGVTAIQAAPAGRPSATVLREIRSAYEDTVMSAPLYEEEYGDTYEESLGAEFGPEVVAALTDPECFGPTAKEALLAGIEQARAERVHFLESCEREAASVDAAASTLIPLEREFRACRSSDFGRKRFDTLEEYRERLLNWNDNCEGVATDRQAVINRHRRDHRITVDAPDLSAYLYEDLDRSYPVLALCSDLAGSLDETRRRVERAMTEAV